MCIKLLIESAARLPEATKSNPNLTQPIIYTINMMLPTAFTRLKWSFQALRLNVCTHVSSVLYETWLGYSLFTNSYVSDNNFKSFTSNKMLSQRRRVFLLLSLVNCPANTALLFLCYDNLKQLSRNDHNFWCRENFLSSSFQVPENGLHMVNVSESFRYIREQFSYTQEVTKRKHCTPRRRKLPLWR